MQVQLTARQALAVAIFIRQHVPTGQQILDEGALLTQQGHSVYVSTSAAAAIIHADGSIEQVFSQV